MDELGSLPLLATQDRRMLEATDYLVPHIKTKALPYGAATGLAKLFTECTLLRHGAAEVVTTDRGQVSLPKGEKN